MTVAEKLRLDSHEVRILAALAKKPMRFRQIERSLDVDSPTVNRALKNLREELLVVPQMIPAGSKVYAQYHISRRGEALLRVATAAHHAAMQERRILGRALVAQIDPLNG